MDLIELEMIEKGLFDVHQIVRDVSRSFEKTLVGMAKDFNRELFLLGNVDGITFE